MGDSFLGNCLAMTATCLVVDGVGRACNGLSAHDKKRMNAVLAVALAIICTYFFAAQLSRVVSGHPGVGGTIVSGCFAAASIALAYFAIKTCRNHHVSV